MKTWSTWLSTIALIVVGMVYWIPALAKEQIADHEVASRLLAVIEESGATGMEVLMRSRISLGEVESPQALKELANKWAAELSVPLADGPVSRQDHVVSYQTNLFQDGVQMNVELTGVSKNGAYDTYLVWQLIGSPNSLPYMEYVLKMFANTMSKADLIPQFSTCIRGMYNDKMSVDQQEGRILSIFQALQAKERERLKDETVVSISGYTDRWDSSIMLNGDKMNLQVATHLDRQAGTRITVGTPIITVEY